MSQLSCSSDLEVQERASVLLSFLKFVSKHLEKGENLGSELAVFFDGELNPVPELSSNRNTIGIRNRLSIKDEAKIKIQKGYFSLVNFVYQLG